MTERIELKEINDKGDFLLTKENSTPPQPVNSSNTNLRNEYIGMLLACLSTFFQAFGSFWTKIIQRTYPTKFHTVPFLFLRSFTIMSIALFHTWYCGLTIIRPRDIPLKIWFFYRTNMNFFGMSFFTMSLWYLRASTAQIINSMNPILVFILSYFILKEPYYSRYTIGIIMCVIGSSFIVFNERKSNNQIPTEDTPKTNFGDTIKGLCCGTIALCNLSFMIIANKILAKNRVPINNQLFYVGVCTMTYSAIFVLFFGGVELDVGYLIMCMVHGVFFYLGNLSYNKALTLAPVTKIIIISYLQIVYVFLLAFLFLHESIFTTDLLGAGIMMSYMIYNAYNPIVDKKS